MQENTKQIINEYLSEHDTNSISFLSALFNYLKQNYIKIDFDIYYLLLNEFKEINIVCKKIIGDKSTVKNTKIRTYSNNEHALELLYLYCEMHKIDIVVDEDTFTDNCINDKANLKVLSKDELNQLIKKYKAGDKNARNKIIESNLKLVIKLSKKYFQYANGIDFDDIISEGFEGMIKAIDKFDPDLGYTFATYASWWINHYINRYIINNSKLIRIPIHLYEDINKIKRAKSDLYITLHRNPTIEEISQYTGLSTSRIGDALKNDYTYKSIEESLNSNEDFTLENILEDENSINAEEYILKNERKEYLLKLMNKLNQNDQIVLKLRFGFIDGNQWTLQEIGEVLNLSREGVRLREMKGLKRLRNMIEIDYKKQLRR